MTPVNRVVDAPCHHCGERPSLTFHDDGSIRSAVHFCTKGPPGPPDPPRFYMNGAHWPTTLEGAAQAAAVALGCDPADVHIQYTRTPGGNDV